jgi:hypothetical protein
VELHVRPALEVREVVIDDRDDETYATPFAWVGHQLLRAQRKGHRKRYLTNGQVADEDAIVRFTPDLAAGRYEVGFHPDTPFVDATLPVRVRHADGVEVIRFSPGHVENHSLGVFRFTEGAAGYVEVSAADAKGLVVADAVVFRPVDESRKCARAAAAR